MSHTAAHNADPNSWRPGYLAGTDYSLPHLSRFSRAHVADAERLRHASCGYLSTPGAPPTLLALKQHAQSLCWLLSMLEPHATDSVAVDGRPRGSSALHAAGHPSAAAAGTSSNPFDWFEDLATPYTNDDPDHHRPLFDLANEVKSRHELLGTTFHCPLETHRARGAPPYQLAGDGQDTVDGPDNDSADNMDVDTTEANEADGTGAEASMNGTNVNKGPGTEATYIRRPYASHHNLLMHANLCLERLDHDFSSAGGLLSILPTTSKQNGSENPRVAQERLREEAAARNSLVGQWLMFTQQLVGRMHELEISYANALTALSGEVDVPLALVQGNAAAATAAANAPASLEALGLTTQDHWILTNAGDDVWTFLHALLDQEGQAKNTQAAAWQQQGVLGTRTDIGDRLLYVDVNTRYYRVEQGVGAAATNSRGPLFVCPAWEKHPGIREVADIENRPTVVLVPYTATAAVQPPGPDPAAAPAPGPTGPAAAAAVTPAATALENRYDERLREAGQATHDNMRLARQLRALRMAHRRLQEEAGRLQEANNRLRDAQGTNGQEED